jgi:predicted RNA polymerase sigma factor
MPAEPEARGLLALMLYCESRSAARYANDGEFVPLDKQDTARWSQTMIDEAENHLLIAASFQRMGRYQLEAAIQSIHANRAKSGRIDWQEILLLYEGLVQFAPSIISVRLWGELSRSHNQVNPRLDLLHLNKFRPIE